MLRDSQTANCPLFVDEPKQKSSDTAAARRRAAARLQDEGGEPEPVRGERVSEAGALGLGAAGGSRVS